MKDIYYNLWYGYTVNIQSPYTFSFAPHLKTVQLKIHHSYVHFFLLARQPILFIDIHMERKKMHLNALIVYFFLIQTPVGL